MKTGKTIGFEVKVERDDRDNTQLLATIEIADKKFRIHLRKPDGSTFSGSDLVDLGLHRKKFCDLLDAAIERDDFEVLVGAIWIGKEANRMNAHRAKEVPA